MLLTPVNQASSQEGLITINKSNTFSLKTAIVQRAIDAKLSTGKFVDSGARYSPQQAQADSSNPALRMTATIDGSKLSWGK